LSTICCTSRDKRRVVGVESFGAHGLALVVIQVVLDVRPGWVTTQRDFHFKGVLDADRERRLEELRGWTWDLFAEQWEDCFSRLLRYVECHGDARVPRSYVIDGCKPGALKAPLTPIANVGSKSCPVGHGSLVVGLGMGCLVMVKGEPNINCIMAATLDDPRWAALRE
jgi:hypothetical protein